MSQHKFNLGIGAKRLNRKKFNPGVEVKNHSRESEAGVGVEYLVWLKSDSNSSCCRILSRIACVDQVRAKSNESMVKSIPRAKNKTEIDQSAFKLRI